MTETTLTLWDVGSRSRLHEPLYAGHPAWVLAVGFSPDGATLATASSDLGLRFWDVTTGDSLDVPGFGGRASDVAFSADGAMIASGSDQGTAEIWDAATGASIATFDGTPDDAVALSPDGHLLAVGGDGRVVRVWDVRTRKLVHELDQGGNGAFTLEFSPDGRTLAISGFEPVAVALGRCERYPDRPAAHRRGSQDDDRSLGRRTPDVGGSRQRPRGLSGTSTPSPGSAAHATSPTAR